MVDPETGRVVTEDKFIKEYPLDTNGKQTLIELTVKDMLNYTGIGSLDVADWEVAGRYKESTGIPSFRITGIKLDLRITYEGSLSIFASDRPPKAKLKITASPGWSSLGEVVHNDDEHYLGTGSGEEAV